MSSDVTPLRNSSIMGLKQFNQDISASKAIDIDGVSNIRKGDSDGEVVFTWSLNDATPSLDIQILVLDVDSYPKSSSVMIFTESDHSIVDVSSLLERLSASLANKDVQTIIQAVAEKLLSKVETGVEDDASAKPDVDSDDASDSFDEEELESEYEDHVDEYTFSAVSARPRLNQPSGTAVSIARLKKDLNVVRSAGISVGIYPRVPVGEAEFFSLSLRATKLGIPEHALEAWGLERGDYVVLLCKFAPHYPTFSELLIDGHWKPQFRFGKCSKPKPSIDGARSALTTVSDASQNASNDKAEDTSGSFVPLYMSNSIDMLMNDGFLSFLQLRRGKGLSWDTALNQLKVLAKGGFSQDAVVFEHGAPDTPVPETAMPSLSHDYALDQDEDFSFPMVAMQVALRRFARCTKYCMVCHQRLEDEFEALKPYVCHDPLCVYQFTTLGLGTSIEHDIVSNPYVVDILISFFAAAIGSPKSLRNFPVGLNLKSIPIGEMSEAAVHTIAEACFYDKTIRFDPDVHAKMSPKIKVGDLLMIVIGVKGTLPATLLVNGHCERHVCKVTAIATYLYTFEVISTSSTPLGVLPLPEAERPTEVSNTRREWKAVTILQYTGDTDDLNESDRCVAFATILRGIPSVLDMRTYLLNNPSQRLSSWGRLDKNSLTLLKWIISSNRSLILQDDAVPNLIKPAEKLGDSDDFQVMVPPNPPIPPIPPNPPNLHKVKGLQPHWMQFRFLQGTPERERLFMKEILAASKSQGERSKFPSIFAWHGSGLQNWHSIIRTGLDFNTVQNGRSYGDGVYMSNDFSVSSGYCRTQMNAVETHWPNSLLKPSAAISICEVVNRCSEFVKTTPHYVVKQIEWIQCRYLFVSVDPTVEAMQQPFPTKPTETCTGYVPQQPSRALCASVGVKVRIPLSALPSNRRYLVQRNNKISDREPDESLKTPEISYESDHGDTDHELLLDSEENHADDVARRSIKRRSSSIASTDRRSHKLNTAAFVHRKPDEKSVAQFTTDFVPGSLDLESLPKLPAPSWASTSPMALKTLNRAIKELHEIQRQENLASLGWYIDFDKISNVFHWTVELHSFEVDLPLAKDMKQKGCTSIVLEFRFGANFPFSPPFVRVVRPRFLPFSQGGGGHVTMGGGDLFRDAHKLGLVGGDDDGKGIFADSPGISRSRPSSKTGNVE
ncbi:uncharacterized protein Triagg1_9639 [Trichoderma aggressivum f. europaeum]|uniref:PARP catalytic domain-containing protein n=1 Tax=Trichoderma aggressivum f. europaeum TaxID=173218 RepID=A0AAE1J1S9_9HYPO|nr:hypothetical protein Triagg1_9639 [Trichoderma aggressivum f. europaeum]